MFEVETFDEETRKWHIVAPMTEARDQLGAATDGRYVYAVGGTNGTRALTTVERYAGGAVSTRGVDSGAAVERMRNYKVETELRMSSTSHYRTLGLQQV